MTHLLKSSVLGCKGMNKLHGTLEINGLCHMVFLLLDGGGGGDISSAYFLEITSAYHLKIILVILRLKAGLADLL